MSNNPEKELVIVSTLMHGMFAFSNKLDAEFFAETLPAREKKLTEIFTAPLYNKAMDAQKLISKK